MTTKEINDMFVRSPHTIVSHELIREIGLNQAMVYAELKKEYEENNSNEFVCRVVDLEYELGLSGSKQRKILKSLQDKGYVKVSYKGIPRRRFIEYVK